MRGLLVLRQKPSCLRTCETGFLSPKRSPFLCLWQKGHMAALHWHAPVDLISGLCWPQAPWSLLTIQSLTLASWPFLYTQCPHSCCPPTSPLVSCCLRCSLLMSLSPLTQVVPAMPSLLPFFLIWILPDVSGYFLSLIYNKNLIIKIIKPNDKVTILVVSSLCPLTNIE